MVLSEANCGDLLHSLTLEEWEPLLSLIPEIESTSSFGEWSRGSSGNEGAFQMPWCTPAPVVERFLKVIYGIPIVISFDWGSWDEGRRMVGDDDFDYDSVDLLTKCKLITAIVRNDRFCEGLLVSAFESGLMLKILRSLERSLRS